MTARRFPPPWSVEEQAACFTVRTRISRLIFSCFGELVPRSHKVGKGKTMSRSDYSQVIVDCPSLGLRDVSLSAIERILQDELQTVESFGFVLCCESDGRLTVVDSMPIASAGP